MIKESITFEQLNKQKNREISKTLQRALIELGFLDPPFSGSTTFEFRPRIDLVDGIIGLNTTGALVRFFDAVSGVVDHGFKFGVITPDQFDFICDQKTRSLFPISFQIDDPADSPEMKFLKRVVMYMNFKKHFIALGPDVCNIAYIEGVNIDGSPNNDKMDFWNDRRVVFCINKKGAPQLLMNASATTEPGRYYTNKPMNPKGAARIAFGQYKSWCDGLHNGNQPALVQRDNIRVHRDFDKDGKRTNRDLIEIGRNFGMNQHSTFPGGSPENVGRYSAGCLVGQNFGTHLDFMALVRKDFRSINNRGYLFTSSIISGTELAKV